MQYACDRASEFPSKIDLLVQKLKGGNALLSVQDLEQQLMQVKQKLRNSTGINAEAIASPNNEILSEIKRLWERATP